MGTRSQWTEVTLQLRQNPRCESGTQPQSPPPQKLVEFQQIPGFIVAEIGWAPAYPCLHARQYTGRPQSWLSLWVDSG